jgi:hypothetical protein
LERGADALSYRLKLCHGTPPPPVGGEQRRALRENPAPELGPRATSPTKRNYPKELGGRAVEVAISERIALAPLKLFRNSTIELSAPAQTENFTRRTPPTLIRCVIQVRRGEIFDSL